jgi:hypothetical protein
MQLWVLLSVYCVSHKNKTPVNCSNSHFVVPFIYLLPFPFFISFFQVFIAISDTKLFFSFVSFSLLVTKSSTANTVFLRHLRSIWLQIFFHERDPYIICSFDVISKEVSALCEISTFFHDTKTQLHCCVRGQL